MTAVMPHSIAFIGAGRVATTLATAFSRQSFAVSAIASRHPETASHLAATLPGCRALPLAEAAQADLVFLTVPDDAIAPLAARLPWRSGQQVVHCSGATEVSVLAPAARRGALIGGFHPLQIFSDPLAAIDLLAGSAVAIEAPPLLEERLLELAKRLGMQPLRLPPGARALYHAGAGFAASFLLSMLREAATIWRHFGIAEDDALRALLPLARGTLAAAARQGISGALAGPISRGDAGVLAGHLQALEGLDQTHGAFYREFARRQLALAAERGQLSAEQLTQMAALL